MSSTSGERPLRVGYIVSRFPKTTETFIVREMVAVEQAGVEVCLFAIRRHSDQIVQPGADSFLADLVALSDVGFNEALRCQWRAARSRPRKWAKMWQRSVLGNLRSLKFLVRAIAIAWAAPVAAKAAERRELHHLHAHWATHSALLAHLMWILTDIPYSITLHAHDLHVNRTMLELKLEAAAAAVTISDHNAALICANFPDVADRTRVVHCGVDTQAVAFEHPERRRPGERVRAVTVAGLRDFKGHTHLLAAVDLLKARGREIELHLVGDGPLRTELEQLAGDGVVFHGDVHVDRAMQIVREGDLFVMPSVEMADGRRDGIPVALMEAMAIGRPVIATSVSGIPELVRDGMTGVLVPPADPLALADAIDRFVTDPTSFDELVTAGRTLVELEFDMTANGHQLVEVFSQEVRT
jgi:colanic acid/amylovoran biosynthesis glycosyltransferase